MDHKNVFLALLIVGCLSACKLADLRTPDLADLERDRDPKALAILNEALTQPYYEQLAASTVYTVWAKDNWRSYLAWSNPLPKDNKAMELRYRTRSFDGQLRYTESRRNRTYGVQSHKAYRFENEGAARFKNRPKLVFGLTAIQYFFELPIRLRNAPILKYAGSTEFEGRRYELVLASWKQLAPHPENDQYLLYFDSETKVLRFANFTIRDLKFPVPKSQYGSIRFESFHKDATGTTYPRELIIQSNHLKKTSRWIHKIAIDSMAFDNFDPGLLRPDPSLPWYGDSKAGLD
ncbi:hypothetical protein ABV409_00110 [Flagellimonas sp. DF-77]|uniref:hypothetical protein n=1 Tax=Flagellimonas algarum TaxID=3230298 RepID=UPI003390B992